MADEVVRVLGSGAMGDINDPEKRVTVEEQAEMLAEMAAAAGEPVLPAQILSPVAIKPGPPGQPADPSEDEDEDGE